MDQLQRAYLKNIENTCLEPNEIRDEIIHLINTDEVQNHLRIEFEKKMLDLFNKLRDEYNYKINALLKADPNFESIFEITNHSFVHFPDLRFQFIDDLPISKNSFESTLRFKLRDVGLVSLFYSEGLYEIESKITAIDNCLRLIHETNLIRDKISWFNDHIRNALEELREEEDKLVVSNGNVETSKIQKNIRRITDNIDKSKENLTEKENKLKEIESELELYKIDSFQTNICALNTRRTIDLVCNSFYTKIITVKTAQGASQVIPSPNLPPAFNQFTNFHFNWISRKSIMIGTVMIFLSSATLNYDNEMIEQYQDSAYEYKQMTNVIEEREPETFEIVNEVLNKKLISSYLDEDQKKSIKMAKSKKQINQLISKYFASGKNLRFEEDYHSIVEPHDFFYITPMKDINHIAISFNAEIVEGIKEYFGDDISFGFKFYSKKGKTKSALRDSPPYLAAFKHEDFLELKGISFVVVFNLAEDVKIVSTSDEYFIDAKAIADEYY